MWRNSILISKILRIQFIKYLKIFARVIIRCLRNRLLNCILVVNLILYGLRHVIMLFNLILQPKDCNEYSRDRAKVVPRGSSSPTIPTRFKPLFSLDGNVADSEPYKALADLARVANKWSQFRRNLPPDAGKFVLKELTTRHLDLAHSLKSGLNSNTFRFSAIASPPGKQVSSRRAPVVQPTRLSRTSKLENLLLSDPGRVKVFRKIIDRQSWKPLYKLTKFTIVRVTDHTYITDKGKVFRKNHICLKPNYRSAILVAPNTIGDRVQASGSTSRGAAKRPVTRSQPVLLEQRPNNPPLSTPMVDLTADSSSESYWVK